MLIDGPTREGYYLNLFCIAADKSRQGMPGPLIRPDRTRRHFSFQYNPEANDGVGQIVVSLDGETTTMDLTPEFRQAGATFDHFGLASFRRGGKWVTIYLDDLIYTARRPSNLKPVRHEQKVEFVPYPEGGRKY